MLLEVRYAFLIVHARRDIPARRAVDVQFKLRDEPSPETTQLLLSIYERGLSVQGRQRSSSDCKANAYSNAGPNVSPVSELDADGFALFGLDRSW